MKEYTCELHFVTNSKKASPGAGLAFGGPFPLTSVIRLDTMTTKYPQAASFSLIYSQGWFFWDLSPCYV